jgi:hypothetical protein
MLTCLLDAIPDGFIELASAGERHFVFDPTRFHVLHEAVAVPTSAALKTPPPASQPPEGKSGQMVVRSASAGGDGGADKGEGGPLSLGTIRRRARVCINASTHPQAPASLPSVFNLTTRDVMVLTAAHRAVSSPSAPPTSNNGGANAPTHPAPPGPPARAAPPATAHPAPASAPSPRRAGVCVADIQCSMSAQLLLLAFHGEHFSNQPMLELSLTRAEAELTMSRRCAPSAAASFSLTALGPAETGRISGTVALEASYLNMRINR